MTIRIKIDDKYRRGQNFDLRGAQKLRAHTDWGALVNYDLLGTTQSLISTRDLLRPGAALTLDGRAFSPYGTFEQSAIVNKDANQSTQALRLDSTYEYSNQDSLVTYRAGDVVNGGLAWTRPLRMGGLQAESNFALRPDLITTPLPTLGGIAAVPSTVDVYVNNIKTFSQDVLPGPFSLNNVPLTTGAGNAQVVVTDSAGNQTRTTVPFFAAANLLNPGLSSWSVEGGFPRLSYGSESDDYVLTPVGSATLRRGIFDWMTAESHVEGGAGIVNGGLGAVFKTGSLGVASAAFSGSDFYGGGAGAQVALSYQMRLFDLNVNATSQRTFGGYGDLVSATARLQPISTILALPAIFTDAQPPKALDTITFSAPVSFDQKSSVSASFIHSREAPNNLSEIVSASYTRSMPFNASLYGTVFHDFGTNKSTGIVIGLSFPLGDSASASSTYSRGGGQAASLEATKAMGLDPGSYGWSVQDSEGGSPVREASASYRSTYGVVRAGADMNGSNSGGALELRGSIVTMDGDVFLSNWIDDSFGVVEAGAPGIPVLYENRPVGSTDSKGMLLVPTLRSYEKNNITIDPTNLPVDAEVEGTSQTVSPANHGGLLVNFKVHSDTDSALVIFTMTGGAFVPAGSPGKVEGGDDFVVGYDGQSFVKHLRKTDVATIETPDGTCRVGFDFAPRPGEQVRIGPLVCQQTKADAASGARDGLGLRN
jgi:outer membrane usher protein